MLIETRCQLYHECDSHEILMLFLQQLLNHPNHWLLAHVRFGYCNGQIPEYMGNRILNMIVAKKKIKMIKFRYFLSSIIILLKFPISLLELFQSNISHPLIISTSYTLPCQLTNISIWQLTMP